MRARMSTCTKDLRKKLLTIIVMQMDEVILVWSKPYRFEDEFFDYSSFFQSNGIYMIIADGKIWYIGQTIHFRRRLKEHRRDLETEVSGHVSFKIGEMQPITLTRITSRLVDDVENLLIYIEEPANNKIGKGSYRGRALTIYNVGYRRPLKEEYCSDDYVDYYYR